MEIPENGASGRAKVVMAIAMTGAVTGFGAAFLAPNNWGVPAFLTCAVVNYIAWLWYLAAQPRRTVGTFAWLAWVPIGVLDGTMACGMLSMRIEMALGKPFEFPWSAALGTVLGMTLLAWFVLRNSRRRTVLMWMILPAGLNFLLALSIRNYVPTVDPSGEGRIFASLFVRVIIGIAAFELICRLVALLWAWLDVSPAHLCSHCGYDLTGSLKAQSYQCPECGGMVELEQRKQIGL
jgi:DNA-directed RNA polymerase subunit RPC12/RpoP